MKGWAGLVGTFLPMLIAIFCAWGSARGRKLWFASLAANLISFACFVFIVASFYLQGVAQDSSIYSPIILESSLWSGETSLRWSYQTGILALAASGVIVCFHFLARQTLESSRAAVAGLSAYLSCLLGVLGSDNLLLFTIFLAGSFLPRFVFVGMSTRDSRIDTVKETAFLSMIALFSLSLCVMVFSEPFKSSIQSWFLLSGTSYEVRPGAIGLSLLLLATAIIAGIFPFHGNARKIFEMESLERAIPLALQPLMGFTLLFRFALELFSAEFQMFSPYLLGFFSIGVAYCAVSFLGSKSARERVFWLQQAMCSLIAIGVLGLNSKGWHGASALLFFQSLVVPLFLMVLVCHERRGGYFRLEQVREYPAFALSTVFTVLSALFLPVTIGFYGVLLVIWSLVHAYDWPLPFVIISVPLIAFAGMRIMFFRLNGESAESSGAKKFEDLNRDELISIIPISLILLVFGLVPKILLGPMGVSVSAVLRGMGIKD